jgi:hypothetical protein
MDLNLLALLFFHFFFLVMNCFSLGEELFVSGFDI